MSGFSGILRCPRTQPDRIDVLRDTVDQWQLRVSFGRY
ncbi:MAG: hypothetical protein ACJAY5_000990 [Actinomycetes bacterium]|jgi:hypothetical protein